MAMEVIITEVKTHTINVNAETAQQADLIALAYVADGFNGKSRESVEHAIESSKAEASYAVTYAFNFYEDAVFTGNIEAIVS